MHLDVDPDGEEISMILAEITKQNTVPYIFIEGKFIGGYEQLESGLKSGSILNEFKRLNIKFSECSL